MRRDARVLALRKRVVFSHHALQFREFADHFCQQVGLGKPRRTPGLLHIGAGNGRKLRSEPLDALDALPLRAELLVENNVLEFLHPVFQPNLEIGLVEELRIGEPSSNDALVAGDNRGAAIFRLDVGDKDEFVGERCGFTLLLMTRLGPKPCRGGEHEAFLVVADGGCG